MPELVHDAAAPRVHQTLNTRLRRWRHALCLAGLLAGGAQAGVVTLDTTSIAGTDALLEISVFDGDGIAGNSVASAFSQLVTDFGQILQPFAAGGLLSFHLDYQLSAGDALVVSVLDAGTNFSLFDTDLDALEAAVPYQDAVLVCIPGAGPCLTATASEPQLQVSFVPAPGTLALLATLPLATALRRRGGRVCMPA